MHSRKSVIPIFILLSLNILALVPLVSAQTGPVIKIATSITPFGSLVDEVGGDLVETTVLLPEGVEPHAFSPTPQIIQAAKDADLLVFTGHFSWEQDIAAQVDTPYITLEDYEDYGAALSQFPGKSDTDFKNPHGYWLLPKNAIAIANATRATLTDMKPTHSDQWLSNFNSFVKSVKNLQDFIAEADTEHNLASLHAVVVFPAEAYIAEAFGITVEAVLQEGGNIFLSGSRLVEVQQALQNGSINIILGSDVGDLQAGGQFAEQLAQDTGATIVWWRAVFTGTADYSTLMSYDLGILVEGLTSSKDGSNSGTTVIVLLVIAGMLAVVSIVEGVILVQRAREE
ncbi:MAG: metal ABC transporter substrate-binding protein [Candidatus Thorarchaeota archaeon]|nr:metal ABC transporter substrate-binding protein [Candidatus Thorarchaeota archaeon]